MFSTICKRIAYFCIEKDIIRASDTDWFIYAIQKRLFSISVLTLFFGFCIVVQRFIIGVAFLGGFKLLRNCMNGYHASSPLRCALLSLSIFIFGIYSFCPIAIRFPLISSILSWFYVIYIYNVPPTNSEKAPLSDSALLANHNRGKQRSIVLAALVTILPNFFPAFAAGLFSGMTAACISLQAAHIKRRIQYDRF